MNWDGPIARTIGREGGFVDDPDDPGGATNRGITLTLLTKFLGRPATVDELVHLSENQTRMIYLQIFVKDTNLEALGSEALMETMFDWMVNSGPEHAIAALQRQLGVAADGILGHDTAAVANTKDGTRLSLRLLAARTRADAHWVAAKPVRIKFLEGLVNRCMEQVEALT